MSTFKKTKRKYEKNVTNHLVSNIIENVQIGRNLNVNPTVNGETLPLFQIADEMSVIVTETSEHLHEERVGTKECHQLLLLLNAFLQIQGMKLEELIGHVQRQAKSFHTECVNKIGDLLKQLSEMIERYYLQLLSENYMLNQENCIEFIITDHLLWRWKIYLFSLGYNQLNYDGITEMKNSQLSKWYYGEGSALLDKNELFTLMKQALLEVYATAKKVCVMPSFNGQSLIELDLNELTKQSSVVLIYLRELQQLLEKRKELHIN